MLCLAALMAGSRQDASGVQANQDTGETVKI
jgi:hypothetical protein